MIRMQVGHNHAVHRLSTQRLCEGIFPLGMAVRGIQAAINNHPAVTVGNGVQVDVVQCDRQTKAQPQDALRHSHRLPIARQSRLGIGQSPFYAGQRGCLAVSQVRLQ